MTIRGLRVLASSHSRLAAEISGYGKTYFVKDVVFSGVDILGNRENDALDYSVDGKNTEHVVVRKEVSR